MNTPYIRKMATTADGFNGSGVDPKPGRAWVGILFACLIAIAAGLWVYNHNQTSYAITETSEMALESEMVPASEVLPQTLDTLWEYLNAPVFSELPKRFRFENLYFDTGGINLMAGAEPELHQIANAMKAHPKAKARLEGFTDNVGLPEVNKALSERRAQAVKDQLVARGVAAEQLEAVGMGPENPVTSNESIEGRAMNRRIEFVVTEVP
ncbi:MAG: OmpA family protein [Pseudobdellovibrionaceae bacterium]